MIFGWMLRQNTVSAQLWRTSWLSSATQEANKSLNTTELFRKWHSHRWEQKPVGGKKKKKHGEKGPTHVKKPQKY